MEKYDPSELIIENHYGQSTMHIKMESLLYESVIISSSWPQVEAAVMSEFGK